MHSEEAKVYIALLIAAGILGIILILFILSILYQQRKHWNLHTEKIHAEIKTLENERRRIARDLHDEIAVLLSVAKLKLSAIENLAIQENMFFANATDHIDDALNKIREIAKDLMPVTLERKGLVPALREFFIVLNNSNKIFVRYSLPDTEILLAKHMQIHLYRIIQEVIHNTLKHAEATEISIKLIVESSCLKLSINDNGKGFDYENTLKAHGGLGLHNISSRVEILDGQLYMETAIGKGVSYDIEVPINTSL